MTTVRIDHETKKSLLQISAKLQAKRGEKITFNETIKYLLEQYTRREQEEIDALFGILADANVANIRELVQQLRKEGYERVKSLERSVSD